jgi:hypothetical protein
MTQGHELQIQKKKEWKRKDLACGGPDCAAGCREWMPWAALTTAVPSGGETCQGQPLVEADPSDGHTYNGEDYCWRAVDGCMWALLGTSERCWRVGGYASASMGAVVEDMFGAVGSAKLMS